MNENERLNPEELQTPQLSTDVDKQNESINSAIEDNQPTEEEIREEYIKQLKASRIRFRPIKNAVKTVSETRVKSKFGNIRTERMQEVQTNVLENQFDKKYKQLSELIIVNPLVKQRLQWALSKSTISREIGSLTLMVLIRNTDIHKPEIDEAYLYLPEFKRLVSTLLYTYMLVLREKI